MVDADTISAKLHSRLIPWNRLAVMGLLLACASFVSGSLWLVESGVQDLDGRIELRRQAIWEFESLRQRVANYHNRRDFELAAERKEIELSYVQLARDWRSEQPIAGLFPMLRSSHQHLQLVLASTDGSRDGDREQ